jgi:methylated-DNA-protein-cysteine methyltransferase-like protein
LSKKESPAQKAGFYQQVYELVKQVPHGHVVTYGQIAAALGNVRRARLVGYAMRACPENVPWHRVVNAQGGLSTHAIHGSYNPQRARLEDEGVEFDADGRIDLHVYGWNRLGNG